MDNSAENSTLPRRARLRMASVGAGFLAVFILGYGNQALESWRLDRQHVGPTSLRPFFSVLNETAWRFTAPGTFRSLRAWSLSGPIYTTREWICAAVRDVAIVVLTWLLLYAVGRGISATHGRMPIFLGTLGSVVFTVAAVNVAVPPIQFGTGVVSTLAYFDALSTGLVTGLLLGLAAALLVLLTYRPGRSVSSSARHDPASPTPARTDAAESESGPESQPEPAAEPGS